MTLSGDLISLFSRVSERKSANSVYQLSLGCVSPPRYRGIAGRPRSRDYIRIPCTRHKASRNFIAGDLETKEKRHMTDMMVRQNGLGSHLRRRYSSDDQTSCRREHRIGTREWDRQQPTDVIKQLTNSVPWSDWRSPGVYYISKTTPNPNNWIIFLEGGDGCGSVQECNERYREYPHLLTSRLYPLVIKGTDIFKG